MNSVYKRIVPNENTFGDVGLVPRDMRRAQDKSRLEDTELDGHVNSDLVRRLFATPLFESQTSAFNCCRVYTTYSVESFYDVMYNNAKKWDITSHSVYTHSSADNSTVYVTVTCAVLHDTNDIGSAPLIRSVSITNHGTFTAQRKWFSFSCHCALSRTAGLPCVQVTAVALTYRQYTAANSEMRSVLECRHIQVAEFLHDYWKRDLSSFKCSQTYAHWATTAIVAVDDPTAQNRDVPEEEWETTARQERRRCTTFARSRSLHDRAW